MQSAADPWEVKMAQVWRKQIYMPGLLEVAFYPFSHFFLYPVYTLLAHKNSRIIIIVRLRIYHMLSTSLQRPHKRPLPVTKLPWKLARATFGGYGLAKQL